MLRRIRGQTVQRGDEGEGSVRTRNSVPLHQVFCQEQIPDGRQDRDQQNADRSFTLIEQSLHQRERAFEVAGGQRVAQLEDDTGAGKRHQLAHLVDVDLTLAAQVKVDLFQFVLDLAGVATGQQHEKIERLLFKLQAARLCASSDDLGGFLFPARAGRVEPVDHLQLSAFAERLVKRAPLVDFGRADQQGHFRTQPGLEQLRQIIQSGLHRSGAANDAIAQTVCVFQPDQFSAAEKWKRLQSLDRRSDSRNRLIDVVRASIDDFDPEFPGVGRRQFRRQLRRRRVSPRSRPTRQSRGYSIQTRLFSLLLSARPNCSWSR